MVGSPVECCFGLTASLYTQKCGDVIVCDCVTGPLSNNNNNSANQKQSLTMYNKKCLISKSLKIHFTKHT